MKNILTIQKFKTEILLFAIIIFGVIIVACGKNKSVKEADSIAIGIHDTLNLSAEQFQNIGITLGGVQKQMVGAEIELLGKIMANPDGTVTASCAVGGVVNSILVRDGDKVRKGQILCIMENLQVVDWQEGLMTAMADAVILQQEFERQQELYKQKASSQRLMQAAEAAYRGNLAKQLALVQRLNSVGINQDDLKFGIRRQFPIRSSANGTIQIINVHSGQSVLGDMSLMDIAVDGGARWVLNAYEAQTGLIVPGLLVILSPSNGVASALQGKIIAVSPIIQNDRSWQIYCQPNVKSLARPGQAIKGKVLLKSGPTNLLPDSVVFVRDGKNYCFVDIGNHQYALTQIKILGKHEEFVMVTDAPLSKIVFGGAYDLWMMWDAQGKVE